MIFSCRKITISFIGNTYSRWLREETKNGTNGVFTPLSHCIRMIGTTSETNGSFMAVKLNVPTAELVRINVDEHPLFKRIWDDKTITRITDANAETVTKAQGLSALCIVDDPVMYKETLDMAVIGPELFNLFGGTLTAQGFTDPAFGRRIANTLGIRRLPALAVFRFGEMMGAIEGLQDWDVYEAKLVEILTGETARPKRKIVIGNA